MKPNRTVEAINFKRFRKEKSYTQQAFASLLEIGKTTADIERGKSKISAEIIVRLIELFDLNPLWLYGKSNEKFLNGDTAPSVAPKIISIYPNNNDTVLLVNEKAAAGYPVNLLNQEWYEKLPAFDLPLPQFQNATYRGFQVEGDSMLPHLAPKDWVIGRAISSVDEIINNKVYVVVLRDALVVKVVQKLQNNKLRLVSYNEHYQAFEVSYHQVQELWLINSKLSFSIENQMPSSLLNQLKNSMHQSKNKLNVV